MKLNLKSIVSATTLWFTLLAAAPVQATQQMLIVGDSLSKEYEYELHGIGGNDDAEGIRNWAEILDEVRHSTFDFGSSAIRPDLRLLGHKYNWSVPGSFAKQWPGFLNAGFPKNYAYGIPELNAQVKDQAERAVVFLGGNDLRINYRNIYLGKSPSKFIGDTYTNITSVVNWMRKRNTKLQIVLVSVPHIGCTPHTDDSNPYNKVKTGRVTNALTKLNSQLASYAAKAKIGFCPDIFEITKDLLTKDALMIGNEAILKTPGRSDGNPHYLFLGDGFHPNQPCQAVFAQRILDCFNARYNLHIPRLTDDEILSQVLNL